MYAQSKIRTHIHAYAHKHCHPLAFVRPRALQHSVRYLCGKYAPVYIYINVCMCVCLCADTINVYIDVYVLGFLRVLYYFRSLCVFIFPFCVFFIISVVVVVVDIVSMCQFIFHYGPAQYLIVFSGENMWIGKIWFIVGPHSTIISFQLLYYIFWSLSCTPFLFVIFLLSFSNRHIQNIKHAFIWEMEMLMFHGHLHKIGICQHFVIKQPKTNFSFERCDMISDSNGASDCYSPSDVRYTHSHTLT